MNNKSRIVLASLSSVVGLFSVGCAFDGAVDAGSDEDEPIGVHEDAIESENRLSLNRLSLNRLSLSTLSQKTLNTNAAYNIVQELMVDESGRQLLKYLTRCALSSNQSFSMSYQGVSYTFQGRIGLAPDWMQNPLSDAKKRRWVSACLLAHANGYGIEVPISLRGANPALAITYAEYSEYSVQEAAFFGDVFDAGTADDSALKFFSCGGSTMRSQCGNAPASFRPQRSCADSASCLLEFEGMCRNSTGADVNSSCKTSYSWNGYSSCYPATSNNAGKYPAGATEYQEVITVYLRPAEFNQLYAGCADVQ